MRLLRGNLWSVLQPSDKNTFKDREIKKTTDKTQIKTHFLLLLASVSVRK